MILLSGMPRRKKKFVHVSAATDDKKLQSTLKKLAVNNIAGIEEVNLIKNDGSVIHFNNPRTQASLQSNVFAITGHAETKNVCSFGRATPARPQVRSNSHESNCYRLLKCCQTSSTISAPTDWLN